MFHRPHRSRRPRARLFRPRVVDSAAHVLNPDVHAHDSSDHLAAHGVPFIFGAYIISFDSAIDIRAHGVSHFDSPDF
jgi:hypothetical protein